MRGKRVLLIISLLLAALLAVGAMAQSPRNPMVDQPLDPQSKKALERGTRFAVAISTVTSTAVSPLLGVCVLGAYEYFHTPAEGRTKLPAYTKPWFWSPVIVLLLVIFFKDSVGSHMPLLKKPLDAAEVLLVNKASLLLIGFPVVFHEAARMMGLDSLAQIFASLEPVVYAQDGVLQKTGEGGMALLLVIAGLVITTAVWLFSHAMDVLLLLNPFPMIDLLIKGVRAALFAVLAALTVFDPRIAAVLSGFLILISLLMVGWTFRLAVFGAIFSSDLMRTLLWGAFTEPLAGETVSGFAARKWNGIPKRGLIKMRRDAGNLVVTYRPFLAGRKQECTLATSGFDVGRGLFYPLLVEKGSNKTVIWFLPRYRKQEDQMARVLGAGGPHDLRLGRGWRAFVQWMNDDGRTAEAAPTAGMV
ncbi:MAG: hypothetical protein HY820_16300 [Acidobacteria bacterium]|nr:hypothetical protein [Acidobacteriota bacterium]